MFCYHVADTPGAGVLKAVQIYEFLAFFWWKVVNL